MVRDMAGANRLRPGYVVKYPNREKRSSKVTKATVAVILLVSVALILAVTVGGWSELEGLQAVNFIWCAIYLIIAFYVWRWARGLLPIAAALASLMLIVALIAGTGVSGTSWFDRSHEGYATAQSLFGGSGLGANTLGVLTLLIVPVQVLLIVFAARGFLQGWNIELEVPGDPASVGAIAGAPIGAA